MQFAKEHPESAGTAIRGHLWGLGGRDKEVLLRMRMMARQIASKPRQAANLELQMFMTLVRSEREELPSPGAIVFGAATAQHLALNFMGMKPGETLERGALNDIPGELANILCGGQGAVSFEETAWRLG